MIDEMIQVFPQEIIDEAVKMHGYLAPGIIIGFKLALRALKELQPQKEDIIMLTSETTRCIPDGLQTLSRYLSLHGGYHLYHRAYDVGKLAIQVSKNHKDLFRIILNEEYVKSNVILNAWANLGRVRELDAKHVQVVLWDIDLDKGFLKKPFEKNIKANLAGKAAVDCPVCGERTTKLTMILQNGQYVCKTCAFFQK